jgi:hypothetical protein
LILAREEEPLDPFIVQFPQGLTLEEGTKAKFDCKLSGSTPMTGTTFSSIAPELDHFLF